MDILVSRQDLNAIERLFIPSTDKNNILTEKDKGHVRNIAWDMTVFQNELIRALIWKNGLNEINKLKASKVIIVLMS